MFSDGPGGPGRGRPERRAGDGGCGPTSIRIAIRNGTAPDTADDDARAARDPPQDPHIAAETETPHSAAEDRTRRDATPAARRKPRTAERLPQPGGVWSRAEEGVRTHGGNHVRSDGVGQETAEIGKWRRSESVRTQESS